MVLAAVSFASAESTEQSGAGMMPKMNKEMIHSMDASTTAQVKALRIEMESKIKVIRDDYQARIKAIMDANKMARKDARASSTKERMEMSDKKKMIKASSTEMHKGKTMVHGSSTEIENDHMGRPDGRR